MKKGDIVEVVWLDASSNQRVDLKEVIDITPTNHLIQTTTYGIVWSVDDKAILLLEEYSLSQVDYTTIPIDSIVKYNLLKGGKLKINGK